MFNRMNDYYFKYLVGSEENKDLALDFINAALERQGIVFTDIIFVDKDQDPKQQGSKASRLDVKGKLNDGSIVELEMQVLKDNYMSERSLFYWSRMYGRQIAAGQKYDKLKPAISINILEYSHLQEDCWFNEYKILNITNGNELTDHLHIMFLELGKLRAEKVAEMSKLELWGAYFGRLVSDEELKEVPMMEAVLNAEMYFAADEAKVFEYEQRERWLWEQHDRELDAEARGEERGEDKFAKLVLMLQAKGRADEIAKAASNVEYRKNIFKEFDIE